MPKRKLQTALEARRWMVANPWKELEDNEGDRWRWNPDKCWLEYRSAHSSVFIASTCVDIKPPFTIIDEPVVRESQTVQTDPQEGTLYHPDWAGGKPVSPLTAAITKKARKATAEAAERFEAAKKQPEWVRITASPHQAVDAYHAIRKNAVEWKIEYPGHIDACPKRFYYGATGMALEQSIYTLHALQIGAVVEYLPEEGE